MIMSDCFLHMALNRRSVYGLGKDLPLKKDELLGKIQAVIKMAPSAYNCQSARVVVLFEENHKRLWEIVSNSLEAIVPLEKFTQTAKRIADFTAAYGTILFFIDSQTVDDFKQKYPLYESSFEIWAEQENGMLQYALWVLLAENRIGANLQHYNPLIDDTVKNEWHLSSKWKLTAQMPFGNITQTPGEKTFLPLSERIRIFK